MFTSRIFVSVFFDRQGVVSFEEKTADNCSSSDDKAIITTPLAEEFARAMPDNREDGYRLDLRRAFQVLFFNDKVLRDGNVQSEKTSFERGEAERIVISFQNVSE